LRAKKAGFPEYDTSDNRKGGEEMNMQESSRLILGLREKGWTDTEITDFILWIETGEEQYRPKADPEKK